MADESQQHYDVPWAENLRHRPRPNEVPDVHVPAGIARYQSRPPADRDLPTDPATAFARPAMPAVQDRTEAPSYYDISILKQPVWKWQIASYFFFGGLSAGAYVLSRVAERAGGEEYRDLTRTGTYAAFLSFIPCPPLLIHDLGDPKRFHHMLRAFKPGTPMNLGTWTIVGYSGMAAAAVVREYLRDRDPSALPRWTSDGTRTTLLALHDAAGVPFALLVAGYTGVLLSCTSNPLWCKNNWLGPLFSASSIATGAEAIMLALDCTDRRPETPSKSALETVDTIAHAAEAVAMKGYTRSLGARARPLTHGSMKGHKRVATGCLVAAEVLNRLPLRGQPRRWARMASAALGLASGFALRWAVVHGGQEAAADPRLARLATRPETSAARRGGRTAGAS